MLKITEPTLMFCDPTSYELVKKCLDELGNAAKIFVFGESIDGSESVKSLFNETHIEDQFWYAQSNYYSLECNSFLTDLNHFIVRLTLMDRMKQL